MMFRLLALILYFAKFYNAHPFILNELKSCYYNSSDNEIGPSFTSKLWRVEHHNILIYYTLCGYVPQNTICGTNAAACMKNKQYNSTYILGTKFILGNTQGNTTKLSLETEHGSLCKSGPNKRYKLIIEFECLEEMKETRLKINSECEYVIYMVHPTCQPKCTTQINGQFIDLRPLRKYFFVQSKERNFSIMLCGLNKNCSNSVSICEIKNDANDGMTPLSDLKNEIMLFNQQENDIIIRGSYRDLKKKDKRKIDLIIRCNWDVETSDIVYKAPKQQGRHYRFEMESSFGCIKLPPNCVVSKDFFIYNLTNLYNSNGYVPVLDVPNRKIYLNLCGPLNLRLNDPKNNCSRSFSQVCELNNGSFLNKGSLLSHFDIVDDIIKVTFTNGAICNDPHDLSRQHSTHIDLFCSNIDEGPKFVRSEICDTFINWYTPLACPLYDESRCTYMRQEFQNCSKHFQGAHYDITPLTLNNSNYEIEDISNNSIIYLLNVCGPVTVPDAPCMKNSMVVMKDLYQNNIKNRIKSLGKMDTRITIVNGGVVIRTLSGSYCGKEGDYSSVINFICSSIEVKPKLVNRTECIFHFEWKTPYACPKKDTKCLIQDATNTISLNFGEMKQTSLKINHNKTYEFDLCKEDYKECLKGDCVSLPVKKTLLKHKDKTYIEVILPNICEYETDISVVLFEIICDNIINNEHFKFVGIENCTVTVILYTSLVCPKQDVQIDVPMNNENSQYIINEQILSKDLQNCSVTNHLTGYKFNISKLELNIPLSRCPEITFNNKNIQNSSIMLTYSDDKICPASQINGTFEYKVLLKCSKYELTAMPKKTECSEIYQFEKPEFCKLFDISLQGSFSTNQSNISSTGKIIGLIVGILGLIAMGALVFFMYRKYRRNTYNSIRDHIYQKDADL